MRTKIAIILSIIGFVYAKKELKPENELETNIQDEKDPYKILKNSIDVASIPKKVYMTITHKSFGEGKERNLIIDLYTEECPVTTNNFAKIITGKDKTYKGSIFHRVIPKFMIQGGDIINGNGTGTYSVYGKEFPDEFTDFKHELGALSMANRGPNTNGSQFFFVVDNCAHLDKKHTVFGKLADENSINTVIELSNVKNKKYNTDIPADDIKIVDCGLYEDLLKKKNAGRKIEESEIPAEKVKIEKDANNNDVLNENTQNKDDYKDSVSDDEDYNENSGTSDSNDDVSNFTSSEEAMYAEMLKKYDDKQTIDEDHQEL